MKLPRKPLVQDPHLQKWINHVHKFIETQPPISISPPGYPSNIRVTPGPGMNQVSFTGGQGAERHLLLVSPTRNWDPTSKQCHLIDIGSSTEFPHVTGIPATTYYYYVIAVRNGLKSSPPTGPVGGTTLALNTPLVPPVAPKLQPGNVVKDVKGSPTINVPGLTRGGREP